RTGGTIGKSYLLRKMEEVSVFASYLIRIKPLKAVNVEFLKLFMESPLYWQQLRMMSAGTGQPNVNATNLKKLLLPLPPFEEQERIVSKVRGMLKKVDQFSALEKKMEVLNSG